MARITLDERDCRKGRLPMVCMVCGEKATNYMRRKFAWEPQVLYVLILLGIPGILVAAILISALRKTMTIYCPVCDEHQTHWQKKTVTIWGMLGAWFFLLIILTVVGGNIRGDAHVGPFIVIGILFTLVMFIVLGLVSTRGVRAKKIADHEITLVGVHETFVEETESDFVSADRPRTRRYRDDEDNDVHPRRGKGTSVEDGDGPRRRQRERDDDEDDVPRRRQRPDDEE